MRTEIKAALVLGLFGILGTVIWSINSGRKSRVELPLDVSSADLEPSGQTTFASDFQKIVADDYKSQTTSPPLSTPPVNERNSAADIREDAAENPIDSQLGDDSESNLPAQVETDRPTADHDEMVDPDQPDSASSFAARDGNASDAPIDTTVQPQATVDQPLEPEPGGNIRLSALNRSPNTDTTYIIQPGDTFISIARRKYGHDKYWKAIQAANPELEATRLQEDHTIKLPSTEQIAVLDRTSSGPANEAKPTEPGGSKPQRATYIVEPGDTLTAIARKLLEDESRWDEIYELNRDKLNSPDRIVDGIELRIPQRKPRRTD